MPNPSSARPRKPITPLLALLGLLVAIALPGSPAAAAPEAETLDVAAPAGRAALEAVLDEAMDDHLERHGIAGASVTVVHGGEPVVSKGYGLADVAAGTPVEADATILPTASVSKLFTWTAVMQLVEEGKLDLDDEVNRHLDGFEVPDDFAEPVRVRHLLSHTAGFEDKPQIGLYVRDDDDPTDLASALLRYMPEQVWGPGRVTAYSNYSTALAAHLVAEVSGMPWEDYLARRVFEPLGMSSTTARQPVPAELAPDVSKVYRAVDGALVESAPEVLSLAPAGGVSATSADMGRFMLAHLGHGRLGEARILEAATARQMQRQLFTHDARLPGNAHGFWESTERGQRVLSHPGDHNTSHTLLALLPEHDLGFYVAYNSAGGAEARAELWEAFLAHVVPTEPPPVEPARTAAGDLTRFTGAYAPNRVSTSTLAKVITLFGGLSVSADDGHLVTQVPGLADQRWAAVGPDEFAAVDGSGRMLFAEEGGRISHVFFDGAPLEAYSTLYAWVPVPWYDRAGLHGGILAAALVLMISALVAWPVLAVTRRRTPTALPRGARGARRWAAATAGAYLLFLALFVAALADPEAVEAGLPAVLVAALSAGVGAVAMTLGAMLHTVLAWRRGYWTVAARVHYTLLTAAFTVLAWQLAHWNLLGFQT